MKHVYRIDNRMTYASSHTSILLLAIQTNIDNVNFALCARVDYKAFNRVYLKERGNHLMCEAFNLNNERQCDFI